jgi:thiol:disulfide interchange protein DsbD
MLLPVLLLFSFLLSGAQAQPQVTATARLSSDTLVPGQAATLTITVVIAPGLHINSFQPLEEFLVPTTITFKSQSGLSLGQVKYPVPEKMKFPFSENEMAVYAGTITISAQVTPAGDRVKSPGTITGTLRLQACSNVSCFAPQNIAFQAPFVFKAPAVQPPAPAPVAMDQTPAPVPAIAETTPVEIVDTPATGALTNEEQRANAVLGRGLLYALVAFFLFGMALNLTPCVYPVIPITISFFAQGAKPGQPRQWLPPLFYMLGIALVFALLGLVSSLAGKQWGFLFQSTWFVVAVAMVLLVMAASMFGAFEITVPSFLLTRASQVRQGAAGSLVMGLLVGFLIAPCAAGIIVGLVGLVAKLGLVVQGTLLFFAMGLGLGLPYLVLAMFSAGLSSLPRSGMWMVWVKKIFGLVLVGLALYFLLPQVKRAYNVHYMMFGVLTIFSGLYLGFLDHLPGIKRTFTIIRSVTGVLIVLVGLWLVHASTTPPRTTPDWIYYKGQPLTELQTPGRPLLLDFYAEWCTPCKKMDRVTFGDPRVLDAARNWTFVKVDCTQPDATLKQLQNDLRVSGYPTVILIGRDGVERVDLRMVEYTGPLTMLERLRQAEAP